MDCTWIVMFWIMGAIAVFGLLPAIMLSFPKRSKKDIDTDIDKDLAEEIQSSAVKRVFLIIISMFTSMLIAIFLLKG